MEQFVTIPTPPHTVYMPNTAADGNLPSQEHRVFPQFYVDRRYNETKSLAAGVPIYDEIEMVRMIIAGQNSAEPHRKVTDFIRLRQWPKEYAAWKASQRGEITVGGMPIDIWPGLQADQIIQLKLHNIFTVQQLANVLDSHLGNLGLGGRELRDKARSYLKDAEKGAALNRSEAENADLKKRLAVLETTMARMNVQNSGLVPEPARAEAAPAKRKGWPKGKKRKPDPVPPAAEPTTE